MVRLGLQLTLRSGREALVRLMITAAAVAAGVALLLGVLAEFHAFQANADQACWSCTTGAPVPSPLPAHGELWNDSVDFYQGQTITRLDVAPVVHDQQAWLALAWNAWNSASTPSSRATPTATAAAVITKRTSASRPLCKVSRRPRRSIT